MTLLRFNNNIYFNAKTKILDETSWSRNKDWKIQVPRLRNFHYYAGVLTGKLRRKSSPERK